MLTRTIQTLDTQGCAVRGVRVILPDGSKRHVSHLTELGCYLEPFQDTSQPFDPASLTVDPTFDPYEIPCPSSNKTTTP